jgi:tetratricopeptide (TPR) repeat protein
LYVIACCTLAIDTAAQTGTLGAAASDPDALYARRDQGDSARQAADLWSARLRSDPKAFDAAWKLARACYWLGTHGEEAARRAALERGMEAARTAAAIEPKRPEGPFWMAANMGTLAESFGMRQGIKYRKPIRESLELVLKLDPAFQQGSADRALGRWYFKVPGLFGGSNKQSEEHLRKSLTYNPNSTASWFFLAETLLDMGRKAEAKQALQRVLDAPFDPEWTPEDREWKTRAREKLEALK